MRSSLLAIVILLSSCGGSGSKKGPANDITGHPDYEKGLRLVAKNRCMTCHNVRETFTGPAYRDIAIKYSALPDTIISHLARKIINGGYGVWGAINMTPHKHVSQAEAEAMVRYILLLKD